MLKKINFKVIFATALSLALINSVDIQLPSSSLNLSNQASAKSSGARGGGGSFRSSPSRSSSSSSSRSSTPKSSSSTSPSRSTPRNTTAPKPASSATSTTNSNRSSTGNTGGRASGGSFKKPAASTPSNTRPNSVPPRSPQTQPYTQVRPRPVRVPHAVDIDIEIENSNPNLAAPNPVTAGTTSTTVPTALSATSSSSPDSLLNFLIKGLLLFSVSVAVFLVVYWLLKRSVLGKTNERDNDVVTVSQLQVALLATTPRLQSELSQLTETADTETSEGLLHLLQESALVLLRNSEYWTHVLASSHSVNNREEAETLFQKLSLEQRSKFSVQTLSNVGGRVRYQNAVSSDSSLESADYIVVTLLVGTADDQPLFGEIRSIEALQAALQRVASVQSDYLLVFELLWSPQAQTDSLSYDELLTEYTTMVQIV